MAVVGAVCSVVFAVFDTFMLFFRSRFKFLHNILVLEAYGRTGIYLPIYLLLLLLPSFLYLCLCVCVFLIHYTTIHMYVVLPAYYNCTICS